MALSPETREGGLRLRVRRVPAWRDLLRKAERQAEVKGTAPVFLRIAAHVPHMPCVKSKAAGRFREKQGDLEENLEFYRNLRYDGTG